MKTEFLSMVSNHPILSTLTCLSTLYVAYRLVDKLIDSTTQTLNHAISEDYSLEINDGHVRINSK